MVLDQVVISSLHYLLNTPFFLLDSEFARAIYCVRELDIQKFLKRKRGFGGPIRRLRYTKNKHFSQKVVPFPPIFPIFICEVLSSALAVGLVLPGLLRLFGWLGIGWLVLFVSAWLLLRCAALLFRRN